MIEHIYSLLLFFVSVSAPIPLSFSFLYLFPKEEEKYSFSHSLIVIFTSWCIIQSTIGLLLGIMNTLTPLAFFLSEILIFLTGILLFYFFNSSSFTNPLKIIKPSHPFSWPEKVILVAAAGLIVFLLWLTFTTPITDYDSLAYHLPIMVKWFQNGHLDISGHGKLIDRYLYNWEIVCALCLMPFKEDYAVTFPNFIALFLLILGVYRLAVETAVRRIHALAGSVLLLGMPILFDNIHSIHVELPFAAFIIICIYSIVRYVRSPHFSYLLLFFLSLSMVMGIKTSGLAYGPFLFLITLVTVFYAHYRKEKLSPPLSSFSSRSFLSRSFIIIVTSLIFFLNSGYWYTRNFVECGNPLGFLELKIAGITLFPGPVSYLSFKQTTLASLFNFSDFSHIRLISELVFTKLSIPFLLIILFSIFFFRPSNFCLSPIARFLKFLPVPYLKNSCLSPNIPSKSFMYRGSTRFPFYFLLVSAAAFLFFYWNTPYSASNVQAGLKFSPWAGQALRFAFPFVAVLAVSSAIGLSSFKFKDSFVSLLVFLAILSPFVFYPPYSYPQNRLKIVVIFLFLSFAAFVPRFLLPRFHQKTFARTRQIVIFFIIVFVFLSGFGFVSYKARIIRNNKRGIMYGSLYKVLESQNPPCKKLAIFFANPQYLLYDKNLNRRVVNMWKPGQTLKQVREILLKNQFDIVAVGPVQNEKMLSNPVIEGFKPGVCPFEWLEGSDLRAETVLYRLKNE